MGSKCVILLRIGRNECTAKEYNRQGMSRFQLFPLGKQFMYKSNPFIEIYFTNTFIIAGIIITMIVTIGRPIIPHFRGHLYEPYNS